IKRVELDIHQVFIDHVKQYRRGRLKADDDTLFTGEWWTGLRGIELGLADGVGDLHATLRERFGPDVVLRMIAPRRPLFALPRLGLSAHSVIDDAAAAIDDRALWARLGL